MSLWADYVKERLGWETIESPFGFISYSLTPPECSIEEFYVAPEARGTKLAKRLADEVFERAKAAGAKRVWARVTPGLTGSEHATKTNLHYGFKLMMNRGNDTIMMKEIEG